MDQEDPANGHLDEEPPQRSQQAGDDEAEEVPEGEEEEDGGDGEDEGPGEVSTAFQTETNRPHGGLDCCLFGPMLHAVSPTGVCCLSLGSIASSTRFHITASQYLTYNLARSLLLLAMMEDEGPCI